MIRLLWPELAFIGMKVRPENNKSTYYVLLGCTVEHLNRLARLFPTWGIYQYVNPNTWV